MAQNFYQDGVTLEAAATAKICSGTPVYIGSSGAVPATATSGIDGIAMAACSNVADANTYLGTVCTYQTKGVFEFKVAGGTTFILGDDVFIDAVDNATAIVAGEQEGARTTVQNRATATSGDVAIGKCIGLGSTKALGDTLGTTYIQCQIVARANSNIANK